jgi:hypothetical protein
MHVNKTTYAEQPTVARALLSRCVLHPPKFVSMTIYMMSNIFSMYFQNMGVNKQEHRKKILRSIKSLCGGLPPSTALLIDRTEHGNRLKIKNLDIEKDFDSQ